jgi:hypothetical protein
VSDDLTTLRNGVVRLYEEVVAQYPAGWLHEDVDVGRLDAFREVLDLIDKQGRQ